MLHGRHLGTHKNAMRSCETLLVLEGDKGEISWHLPIVTALQQFMQGEVCFKISPDGRHDAIGIKRALTQNEQALLEAFLEGYRRALDVAVGTIAKYDDRIVQLTTENAQLHRAARHPKRHEDVEESPYHAGATMRSANPLTWANENEPALPWGEEEQPLGLSLIKELGEEPMQLDATRLIKPPGLKGLDPQVIYLFRRAGAWMIKTAAPSPLEALAIGKRAAANLVSLKSLASYDPGIHRLRVFIAFPGGHTELTAAPSSTPVTPKAPSQSDLKASIVRRGKETFGATGVTLTGHAGAYNIVVRPGLKHLRGKFAPTNTSAATLEEISAWLDRAIEKVEALA